MSLYDMIHNVDTVIGCQTMRPCVDNYRVCTLKKILWDVNFAVFADNLPSMKFKSSKFYKQL